MKWFRGHIGGVESYVEAELMGIWEGLNFAWLLDHRNVSCRSDCEVAISFWLMIQPIGFLNMIILWIV